MGPKVAELLGAGKGGGRPGLFQGKVPSFDGLEAAKALVLAALTQVQTPSWCTCGHFVTMCCFWHPFLGWVLLVQQLIGMPVLPPPPDDA